MAPKSKSKEKKHPKADKPTSMPIPFMPFDKDKCKVFGKGQHLLFSPFTVYLMVVHASGFNLFHLFESSNDGELKYTWGAKATTASDGSTVHEATVREGKGRSFHTAFDSPMVKLEDEEIIAICFPGQEDVHQMHFPIFGQLEQLTDDWFDQKSLRDAKHRCALASKHTPLEDSEIPLYMQDRRFHCGWSARVNEVNVSPERRFFGKLPPLSDKFPKADDENCTRFLNDAREAFQDTYCPPQDGKAEPAQLFAFSRMVVEARNWAQPFGIIAPDNGFTSVTVAQVPEEDNAEVPQMYEAYHLPMADPVRCGIMVHFGAENQKRFTTVGKVILPWLNVYYDIPMKETTTALVHPALPYVVMPSGVANQLDCDTNLPLVYAHLYGSRFALGSNCHIDTSGKVHCPLEGTRLGNNIYDEKLCGFSFSSNMNRSIKLANEPELPDGPYIRQRRLFHHLDVHSMASLGIKKLADKLADHSTAKVDLSCFPNYLLKHKIDTLAMCSSKFPEHAWSTVLLDDLPDLYDWVNYMQYVLYHVAKVPNFARLDESRLSGFRAGHLVALLIDNHAGLGKPRVAKQLATTQKICLSFDAEVGNACRLIATLVGACPMGAEASKGYKFLFAGEYSCDEDMCTWFKQDCPPARSVLEPVTLRKSFVSKLMGELSVGLQRTAFSSYQHLEIKEQGVKHALTIPDDEEQVPPKKARFDDVEETDEHTQPVEQTVEEHECVDTQQAEPSGSLEAPKEAQKGTKATPTKESEGKMRKKNLSNQLVKALEIIKEQGSAEVQAAKMDELPFVHQYKTIVRQRLEKTPRSYPLRDVKAKIDLQRASSSSQVLWNYEKVQTKHLEDIAAKHTLLDTAVQDAMALKKAYGFYAYTALRFDQVERQTRVLETMHADMLCRYKDFTSTDAIIEHVKATLNQWVFSNEESAKAMFLDEFNVIKTSEHMKRQKVDDGPPRIFRVIKDVAIWVFSTYWAFETDNREPELLRDDLVDAIRQLFGEKESKLREAWTPVLYPRFPPPKANLTRTSVPPTLSKEDLRLMAIRNDCRDCIWLVRDVILQCIMPEVYVAFGTQMLSIGDHATFESLSKAWDLIGDIDNAEERAKVTSIRTVNASYRPRKVELFPNLPTDVRAKAIVMTEAFSKIRYYAWSRLHLLHLWHLHVGLPALLIDELFHLVAYPFSELPDYCNLPKRAENVWTGSFIKGNHTHFKIPGRRFFYLDGDQFPEKKKTIELLQTVQSAIDIEELSRLQKALFDYCREIEDHMDLHVGTAVDTQQAGATA